MKSSLLTLLCVSFLAGLCSPIRPLMAASAPAHVQSDKVVLYVLPQCGYCAKTRALLDERKVAYVARNIEDPQVKREWEALGGRGVPLLRVGADSVQGYDPVRIHAVLDTL